MPTIKRSNRKPWMVKPKKTNESWAYDPRYHTTRWRKYRHYFLTSHPLCEQCKKVNKIVPSKVVDHITPVSKDSSDDNFWNPGNHQALCIRCNNAKKK